MKARESTKKTQSSELVSIGVLDIYILRQGPCGADLWPVRSFLSLAIDRKSLFRDWGQDSLSLDVCPSGLKP
ncbi:MAG: hypothetical protein DRH24_16965 [Deltaproteobacteria bacterium]|nr:MAG: hypothetical protein DRH24_16965 [Deltaproteobacteria bacterium]